MSAQRFASYLKTYRKQSGLTQREVAFLLGLKQTPQFSRYEKQHAIPSLPVALGCEAVFRVPVKELFPGMSDPIVGQISSRIEALTAELQRRDVKGKDARLTARKLSWLAAHHGRLSTLNQ
jgi:transcriptional regulator with XRE-family HTH domain